MTKRSDLGRKEFNSFPRSRVAHLQRQISGHSKRPRRPDDQRLLDGTVRPEKFLGRRGRGASDAIPGRVVGESDFFKGRGLAGRDEKINCEKKRQRGFQRVPIARIYARGN